MSTIYSMMEHHKRVTKYWRDSLVDKHLKIDIFEIEPSYRQQRLGRFFYTEIENYFKDKGFSAIQLFCSLRESKKKLEKIRFYSIP